LSIVQWSLAVVFLLGVHRWCARHTPEAAVPVTLLTMVNVSVWMLYRRPLSEAAFLAVLIWLVNMLESFLEAATWRERTARMLPAIALSTLLASIRHAGVAVAAGFGVVVLIEAWRRRMSWRRSIGLSLGIGIPALAAAVGRV